MATSTVTARRKETHNIKLRGKCKTNEKKVNKCKKGKISLCSKNRLGKNGSLFKVNGGRGPYENMRNIVKLQQPFSRGGPKRGNPTMTTSTVTAKRKGDPQH